VSSCLRRNLRVVEIIIRELYRTWQAWPTWVFSSKARQGNPDLVKIVISPDVRRDDDFDEAHKNHRVSPSTEKSLVVEDPLFVAAGTVERYWRFPGRGRPVICGSGDSRALLEIPRSWKTLSGESPVPSRFRLHTIRPGHADLTPSTPQECISVSRYPRPDEPLFPFLCLAYELHDLGDLLLGRGKDGIQLLET